ncbi:MAG: energy transducer TonB [Gallionella sp.]|nr:energy transducer TonB [Gallionella sp.]
MTLTQPPEILPGMNRNVVITLSVVVFHVAALWALQTGLLRRTVELIVPAEVLVEFIEPPEPQEVPPPPAPPAPVKRAIAKTPAPVKTVSPQPMAIADPTPSPNAPVGVIEPAPVAPPVVAQVAQVAEAPPAPARVELPDYLHNPKPPYPPLSRRLGEQGKVVVRVLVGVDGTAQDADLKQSSGFPRLDQAALKAAKAWRYVPGTRAGVPEAMWVYVPIPFVLE